MPSNRCLRHKMRPGSRSLIIFDLDGTLAETAEDIIASVNHATAAFSVAPLTMNDHRALVGLGGRHLIRTAFHRLGLPLSATDLEVIFDSFISHYESNVAEQSHLFPGALASLIRLRDSGHNLAICTNKSSGPCRALLSALNIDHLFCATVTSDTFQFCKPDPRTLLATIEAAAADPQTSIMVGDSRTDIEAARAAGIPVIAVDFGYSDVPVEDLLPDKIISTFEALQDAVQEVLGPMLRK